jgi:choline dehydrogenase
VLMLSGIGPAGELREHGVAPLVDLPGVGKNMQDHVDCVMSYECIQPVTLYGDLRADRLTWSIVRGMLWGEGIATTFPYETGAFLKSRRDLVAPDLQMHFMPALEKTANLHFPNPFKKDPVEANHGFTLRVGPVNPESRGQITLRSSDPKDPPKIEANYLQAEFDRETMIAGIRMTREVIAQRAFDPYRGRELAPGPAKLSDAELLDWLRASAMTTFHPVGTCKMGNDKMAVLDARLKVRGIDRLRVADASVMPIISSGNTNAPTIMIGEKCAEFILQEAA